MLEPSETVDLRQVNVEDAFERFANLQGKGFKPASLRVFQSRLKSALADFFAYVENPATFKPSGSQRASTRNQRSGEPKRTVSGQRESDGKTLDEEDRSKRHHESAHLIIPIPLRDGLTVRIDNVPADLTEREAEKLAAIVKAYATPDR